MALAKPRIVRTKEHSRSFVDTNIWLYMFSDRRTEEVKKQRARELIIELQAKAQLVVSDQVVNEFARTLLGKYRVPPPTVRGLVENVHMISEVLRTRPDTLEGIAAVENYGVEFWDGMILTSAQKAGCEVLFSEDFQDGRTYGSVKVINPFKQ